MARYFRRGGEFLVNTVTAGDQLDPVIALLASGGFVVMWADSSQIDVKGQLHDAAGNPVGGEFFVNSTTAESQFLYAVAHLGTGGFVACWLDLRAGRQSVVGQLFDAAGAKVGTEFVVDSTATYDQYAPAIAALASGGFVIAWEGYGSQGDGSGSGIRAQLFDAAGVAVGSEILANTPAHDHQFAPALAGLNGGGFVVAWVDPVSRSIRANIFDEAGEQVGVEFVVGGEVLNFEVAPNLVALASGGFAVVWQDVAGIQARVYSANWSPAGDAIFVSSGFGAAVAALPGGGFLVGWSDGDVKAQVFNFAGNKVGGEILVNTTASNYDRFPAIAALSGGGVAVTWVGGDPSGAGINGQLLDLGIEGTAGQDDLAGTSVGDYLLLDHGGDDGVFGDDGDDVIYFGGAFDAADTVHGGSGLNDVLVLQGDYLAGVSIDLVNVFEIEGVTVLSGADTTYGLTGASRFSYLIEIKQISHLYGSEWRLPIDGSALFSDEQLFVAGIDSNVPLFMVGGSGADGLSGSVQADIASGGDGDDFLSGNDGDDWLSGGGGDDHLVGGEGADLLEGGDGFDHLEGGPGADALYGGGSQDLLKGGDGNDLLFLNGNDGFVDHGFGEAGDDGFYFSADFTAQDIVDGGTGADQLALRGNYNLEIGETAVVGIETLALLSETDTRFQAGPGPFDYALVLYDGNVAAGQSLTINGNGLTALEDLTINGSRETNGSLRIFGGMGQETLSGGAQSDGFFFGGTRFNAAMDRVNGGPGADDQLGLRGDFSAQVVFTATTMINIDTIALISSTDGRYSISPTPFSYNLKTHDGNLAVGAQLSVNAGGLATNEVLTFDGSAELDGAFRLIGGAGNDVLVGGAAIDQIFGGLGADLLTGNGGGDIFVYTLVAQSSAAARDSILGFASGDRIDLSAVDAVAGGGDDAFTFIGSGAFTAAGQVRLVQSGAEWLLEANVGGDLAADMVIAVTPLGTYEPSAADLLL